MLRAVGVDSLDALYDAIPEEARFATPPELPEETGYAETAAALETIASKNRQALSFITDGLPVCSVASVTNRIAAIRNLATSYTPYQPERSQGTLVTHWIYQCLMSQLTGFEAINSSLYDRATAIFEAICAVIRATRRRDTVLVPECLYPGDRDVLQTLVFGTSIRLVPVPVDAATGRIDLGALDELLESEQSRLAGVVVPQVNSLGLLEDVDDLTDRVHAAGARVIAVVDPIHLSPGGLKPPTAFGESGADVVVGEAQHLAIGPNFGGPGLGLFGVRFNASEKSMVRNTPGRYVGKAEDETGQACHVMVLSTREQHIRKERATSNICSNQAFLATIAGATLLERGDSGLSEILVRSRAAAVATAMRLSEARGVRLAFPGAAFLNELLVEIDRPVGAFLEEARKEGVHAGVDVSDRVGGGRNLLKIGFSDERTPADLDRLLGLFGVEGRAVTGAETRTAEIPARYCREEAPGIPRIPADEIVNYYETLGRLNISPDDTPYPLGSCTMKYNPAVNEWTAGLDGFTAIHPQAPIDDIQGCLQVLYEIQERFKAITGLPAVTTQPVAGAQGELVGLKLFQAYHAARNDGDRDVVLIPRSAHGTNFATAIMAGFPSGKKEGRTTGIVYLEAGDDGQIDLEHFHAVVEEQGEHIAAVMITNPNTTGIFEARFAEISRCIHDVGGLVYMDGANMNAIAGRVDLGALGVDAVHNNLHKTWTIPHGGGGPGDAIVAVSERLADFLPGYQVQKRDGRYTVQRPAHSIGSFHRHWGNFAHKVRCLTYLYSLGRAGVPRMSAMAVLASRYLFERLRGVYPSLPEGAESVPRMHEFILTLEDSDFERLEAAGVPKAKAVVRVGKLFLDFGFHAPTVAWPEPYGLMIEPTESYTKRELDRFADAVTAILQLVREHPEVAATAPHFTPVDPVDEVAANRNLVLRERITGLPALPENRLDATELQALSIEEISERILAASRRQRGTAAEAVPAG